MNKLLGSIGLVVVGVAALAAAAPAVACLIRAAVPLIVVIGVVAIAARLTWHFTRPPW